MNGWAILLSACVVLAAAKAVVQALHMGIYLAIVIGALTRPRETFGLLAFLLGASLFQAQPVTSIVAAGILSLALMLRSKAG